MVRIIFIMALTLLIAPAVWAQSASGAPVPVEEQSEAMIDTLKRMRIKREENDHKKLLEKGSQILEISEELARNYAHQTITSLPREVEKKLKEIEKNARQIRSESGGSKDEPLESPPATLNEAINRLEETCRHLNEDLSKTSRRVVSVSVINHAIEVIEIVRVLKGFIK